MVEVIPDVMGDDYALLPYDKLWLVRPVISGFFP